MGTFDGPTCYVVVAIDTRTRCVVGASVYSEPHPTLGHFTFILHGPATWDDCIAVLHDRSCDWIGSLVGELRDARVPPADRVEIYSPAVPVDPLGPPSKGEFTIHDVRELPRHSSRAVEPFTPAQLASAMDYRRAQDYPIVPLTRHPNHCATCGKWMGMVQTCPACGMRRT